MPPAAELTLAYEALRAQATGELPRTTPRGMAVLVAHGCTAWVQAWAALVPMPTMDPPAAVDHDASAGLRGELVHLLAEMAVRCHRTRWVSA